MRVRCLLAFSRLISDSISGFAKNRFIPKLPRVTLLEQVKVNDTWSHARAPIDRKGRVRRDHVRINGKGETHPEGSYFIEFIECWDEGKRRCEPAGADAQDAADKARVKQAELTARRHGILPPAPTVEAAQERTSLPSALDNYLEYVRNHRSLRTFRTYRPQKAQPPGCILAVSPDVVLRDLGVQGKKGTRAPGSGKHISRVAKLRSFDDDAFLNVENVFIPKKIDPARAA